MRKTIFITAYNREKIFFKTLNKLTQCKSYHQFKKIIIFQDIKKTVLKKIKEIDSKIEVVKTSYPTEISSLQKCNLNIYYGFKKGFENYKSDYVIHLEDDLLPSYDFLEYHNYIISEFHSNKKFFAVNSFSKNYKKQLNFAYSKFIYGIGKGWSVPKEKWATLKKMYNQLFLEKKEVFFDCYFEQEIKGKYFVIMPYRSRTFEQPSNGLNSKLSEKNNIFNKEWKKSFLFKKSFEIKKYTFKYNMEYSWRDDCLNYTTFNIFKAKIKYIIYKLIKNMLKKLILFKFFI